MDNEKKNDMFDNNAPDNENTPDDSSKITPANTEEIVKETNEEISEGDTKVKPDGAHRKKKLVKLVFAIVITFFAVALLSSAVFAATTNYLFFPKIDEALENALKPKLDIGTDFDISDLLKEGKAELELSNIKDSEIEKFMLSLAYNKNEVSLGATLDNEEVSAVATEKGFAINSNKINDGEYYGFSFKDLEERYEDSSFAYKGESDHAVDKATHKRILELIETFEELKDASANSKKDSENIKKAIGRAYGKSAISDCEYSYGGIKVSGVTRSARCKVYNFGKEELLEFVENLIDEFDEPSASLEDSLKRLQLIDNGENYIVKKLENFADLIDESEDSFNIEVAFAYVNRALSAVVGKLTHDGKMVKFTLDLGEDPQHDTDIYLTIDVQENILSESGDKVERVHKSKFYASYVVNRENDKGTATLKLGCDIDSGDGGKVKVKYDITAKGIFDDRNNKADLSLTVNENGFSLFDALVECNMEDKASSLSLDLEKVTYKSNGKDTDVELPCDIKLTLYKNAGSIRLPRFEDVLDMDASEFDGLYKKIEEYFDGLSKEYKLPGFDFDIGGAADPDEEYTEGEENEELNNIGGTIYAEAFPESSDMELYGYYEKVTNDIIVEHYNFISSTTFLHDAGKGTKSGKYRIDLEKGRIYFEVQEYPEPYYLVKTFEQIDENTVKIGYDTFRLKYSTK